MLILLDQNVPRGLRNALPGHEVRSAPEVGWQRLSNGALLRAAEAGGFDLMITADRSLRFQQNLAGRRLAIVVLSSNKWAKIRPHVATVAEAVAATRPGQVSEVMLG